MTMADAQWRMWRNDPNFSQRFVATVTTDRDKIAGEWQRRSAGRDWERDFDVCYTRL
jgi:hypothetical protein